jgi:DNA-binding MarR family transcriptional regulator/ribosomal protein S18 acetylase RimI-like enzyme
MEFVNQLGLLALGSRMKALSEQLYALADRVYALLGMPLEGRWFPVLRLLHERGPQRIGEIAQAIGQSHSAVSQLADKLVQQGWLESEAADHDRRQRRLLLSDRASATLRSVRPAWRAINDELAQRCAERDLDLLGALDQLSALLEPGLADIIATRARRGQREAVRIVPHQPALGEHFYRLNAAWLRKYFYLEAIDHEVLSNPDREIRDGGGEILYAELDGEIVGTCALKHEGDGVYEFTKMAVDERWQGLGLGRLLMQAALDWYVKRTPRRMLFLESSTRLAPALKLYESVGFEHQPAGKPDSHYQRSDVYMIWREPKT